MPPIRSALFVILGASLLAGCAGFTPVTEATRQTPKSGGSAGGMGPGYCNQPPADPTARTQWRNLCFGRD
ncbi:hypothetical protein [Amaricoccus sp. W119]|uniref:hypothetical protein n=1 Tax=Amaricoccus sp. W119 TaxID=3391833 RepID=UPI0039A6B599